jgi:serine/threonine-protein kinase
MDARDEMGTVFGAYILDRPLGRGGMADVWLARRRGPAGFERSIIIKRILREMTGDPSVLKMFLAEARLVARLHHPNIVQVFDLGDVEGEHYLAMEYVDGLDVATALSRYKKPLPVGFCAQVTAEICRALEHAHALGIVHRDVSPSNVFISREGAIKLGDFGIAKLLGDFSAERTRTGVVKGKLAYIPPEQLRGQSVDGRADIYAAGVLLYELLSGRRLFQAAEGEDPLALRSQRMPSFDRNDVPRALEQICRRAIALDRAERYATAKEMAAALEQIQLDQRWTSESLRTLMRELTQITTEAPPSRTSAETRAARGRPLPKTRWPIIVGVIAAALVVALGTWAVARFVSRAPVLVTAPPDLAADLSTHLAPHLAPHLDLSPPIDLAPLRLAEPAPVKKPVKRPHPRKSEATKDDLAEPFPGQRP